MIRALGASSRDEEKASEKTLSRPPPDGRTCFSPAAPPVTSTVVRRDPERRGTPQSFLTCRGGSDIQVGASSTTPTLKMIFLSNFLLVLLTARCAVAGEDGDLSSLIDKVFGPATPAPTNPGGFIPVKPGNNPDYIPDEQKQPVQQPDYKPVQEYPDDTGLGGDGCTCVPYYLCANDSIITDGNGLIDIRFGPGSDPCPTSVDVCCGKTITKPPDQPITPKPKGRSGCGSRNTDGIGFRITGNVDNEAQFGEFPWMVALLRIEEVNGEKLSVYKCGGALIHENVVLTAAHCVAKENPQSLKARAGEWDTQTAQELYPHVDRYVSKIIVHEKYYSGALHNDIALLVIDEPFPFADNIDIVCLPRQNDVILDNSCWASGWGKDVFGKQGSYQVILKRIELPMVPRDRCESEFRHTRLGPKFHLHDSFVCAGGIEGRDTCKGDGGSPLICPIKGKKYQYQQVGIVAWGIGCGGTTPAAYGSIRNTRVPQPTYDAEE
ncbi:hypothetical protein GE061_005997 [Apolygus lucorum]|uniref:Phenoloxidase-activating factor 2 n=1 Tax=Apolygus lucorum TaxID=248454 RepID=A0A6A4J9B2_APOLU|nr:hypothetical protein GE061_005997 [Apolygus lucorum]